MDKERFLSFAQAYEDLILFHALKDVKQGFYIDVGANDSWVASVTKAFYERGWQGVNIEPLAAEYTSLCQDRPRDLNLRVGAGDKDGEMSFLKFGQLSTCNEAEIAKRKRQLKTVEYETIKVKTITSILDEHFPRIPEIHFCKIDVEGHELAVLQGIDFSRIKPWIFILESGELGTPLSDAKENLLHDNGYSFVMQCAENRYYVSKDKIDLSKHFLSVSRLLEVYDAFIVTRESSMSLRIGNAILKYLRPIYYRLFKRNPA